MFKTKYKNIIFDLGAVLFYFNPEEIVRDLFKNETVFPFSLPDAAKSIEWFKMDKGLLTPQEVVRLASDRFDIEQLFKFLIAIPSYLKPIESGLEIFYKIKSLGYKTYVLSNMPQYCYEEAICKHAFLNEFDGRVYSYQVKAAKPEPAIYEHLIKNNDLNPKECLFIDDLEQNLIGAKKFGIDGILCSSHGYVIEQLKKFEVI